MKEQIKIEDLVKGEWYILKCFSDQKWLFKFSHSINISLYSILSVDCIDNYKINYVSNLHNMDDNSYLFKATKEEVLKYFPDEKFENEFVLPEFWYIEIPTNSKDKILLNNWKLEQEYNDDLFENDQYNYVDSDGSGFKNPNSRGSYTEITFNQFKQYVLKQTNNMENKKLIGYKLIKEEYDLAAVRLEGYCDTGEKNIRNRVFTIESHSSAIKKWQLAGVLDLWFEPVYDEFKVGDWVTVLSINTYNYGASGGDIKPIINNCYKISEFIKPFVRLKSENGWIAIKASELKLATKEEIEAATGQVISMNGKFNLIIRNKKVYHKDSEDITNFILEIGKHWDTNNWNTLKYAGYDFKFKDIIVSKSGCENQETYLSDWVKVYHLIK